MLLSLYDSDSYLRLTKLSLQGDPAFKPHASRSVDSQSPLWSLRLYCSQLQPCHLGGSDRSALRVDDGAAAEGEKRPRILFFQPVDRTTCQWRVNPLRSTIFFPSSPGP